MRHAAQAERDPVPRWRAARRDEVDGAACCFRDLLACRVLLRSDQALYGNGCSDQAPRLLRSFAYAANMTVFATDFAAAMVRMGNLGPPAGNATDVAEVRLNVLRHSPADSTLR